MRLTFFLLLLSTCLISACVKSDDLFDQEYAVQDSAGHWLGENQFVLMAENAQQKKTYYLVAKTLSKDKNKRLTKHYLLNESTSPIELSQQFPHLQQGLSLTFAQKPSISEIKQLIKQALYIVSLDEDKNINQVHQVQFGELLDAIYTQGKEDANEVSFLGSRFKNGNSEFAVWAPTAAKVSVRLFNADKTEYHTPELALKENKNTGVWSAILPNNSQTLYYKYALDVYHPKTQQQEHIVTTDPYSLSLSVNSEYSQIVDLNASSTQPIGWLEQQRPVVQHIEDNIFYELHIGDFSQYDESLKKQSWRGKYLAFSDLHSVSVGHLKRLKKSGLNNIHLLPTFDIGTLNEDEQKRITLSDPVEKLCALQPDNALCIADFDKSKTVHEALESFPPNSSDVQNVIEKLRLIDDFNWGYDPFHYTVPEGSYALNPEGEERIVEFRRMVQSLHNMGFRVIMDVVYNHTHQAGLSPKSVLDKIVPDYYHRLHPITGQVERSTCCDNTATERVMMAKLMTDSLVVWAKDYAIDGFRFDLMAHQPKAVMLAAREAVHAVDSDNYFYGEGWNFGEVKNNQRFVQASQLELGGTELGTFTDRLRDAVRGKGMMASGDDIRKAQGIGNGLYTSPNELRSKADSKANYLLAADQLRVGLAANLATFPIENAAGELVTGKDIPYGDQPTGYALDPADTINYVSKHDNQTLWDNNQYRNDFSLIIDDRVRLHTLSLSYPLLAQGIPFLHMGSELLRSKSFVRDSYDFSHWFNKVDFTLASNNYNVGLPPATTDKQNWGLVHKVLTHNEGRDIATQEHIQFSVERFLELLEIRSTSPLFRLTTADQINQQVRFLNTGPKQQLGLIVMQISDTTDIDDQYQNIIVLFNSSANEQRFEYLGADEYILHPVQARCHDSLICTSKALNNHFVVSKFSAAVFVLPTIYNKKQLDFNNNVVH